MLQTLRGAIGNFLLKVFLGLIVLSFAVWGIGDFLQPSGNQTAARVGKVAISQMQLSDEVRNQLRQMEQMFGGAVPPQLVQGMNLDGMVLTRLIQDELLAQGAADLGIAIDDSIITRLIAENPSFHNEKGVFDRERFRLLAQHAGMQEASYIAQMKKDLAIMFLLQALTADRSVPEGKAKLLHAVMQQKRIADYIYIGPSAAKLPLVPAEKELMAFFAEHKERYMLPESRTIRYLYFSKKQMAEGSGEEAMYQLAGKIEDALAGGAALAEVAKNFDLPLKTGIVLQKGGEAPKDLPDDAAFVAQAFSVEAGSTGGVVLSKDQQTYYVIQVDGITPPQEQKLNAVRKQLTAEWKAAELERRMKQKAEAVEAALLKGENLADIARREGVEVKRSEPLVRGAGPSSSFTEQLFQTAAGVVQGVHPASGAGYVVGQLVSVVPAAPATPEQEKVLQQQLEEQNVEEILGQLTLELQQRTPVKILMKRKEAGE